MKKVALVLGLAAALSSCGGGGGGDPPISSPEGFYAGSTADGRTVQGVILDDNSYYVIYTGKNSPSIAAGFIQGIGSGNRGTFTSSNAIDFNFEGLGALPATLSTTYAQRSSLSGTISYPTLNQANTFNSTYSINYEIIPTLSALAGSYTGQIGDTTGSSAIAFTVSTTGAISGSVNNLCPFTGTAVPRSRGNVFNTSITFGASSCAIAGKTLTGGAIFNATTKAIQSINLTADRSLGTLIIATKP